MPLPPVADRVILPVPDSHVQPLVGAVADEFSRHAVLLNHLRGKAANGHLASVDIADMSATGATALYEVPAGWSAMITMVMVHSNSADCQLCTEIDFGSSATPTDWVQSATLAAMTAADSVVLLYPANEASYARVNGDHATADNRIFYENIITTGASGTAVMSVFGFLVAN